MVENLWRVIDSHANIRRDFVERAGYFRRMNFREARDYVAREIDMSVDYVPNNIDPSQAGNYNTIDRHNSYPPNTYNSNYGPQFGANNFRNNYHDPYIVL